MFGILVIVLTYELLSFGGVFSHSWYAIAVLWGVVAGLHLIGRATREQRLDIPLLTGSIAIAVVGWLTGVKVAVSVFAGLWAWCAARRNATNVPKFLHALIILGALETVLALTQAFLLPSWIFGYHNLGSKVSGTLINHNHFAGLMEMLAFVPLGFAYAAYRRWETARTYTYLAAAVFLVSGITFSLSRMGIFAFLVAATCCGVLAFLHRRTHPETGIPIGAVAVWGVAAITIAGFFWIGLDAVGHRFSLLLAPDQATNLIRIPIYRNAINMIVAHPLGVGPGNFQDVFRQYQTVNLGRLFDHAHNDYLEIIAEWGILPSLFFWGAIAFILIRAARAFVSTPSSRQAGVLLTCIGAISAILVHSLGDFNLQIPSNAMLFFTFLGLAAATPGNAPNERRKATDKRREAVLHRA